MSNDDGACLFITSFIVLIVVGYLSYEAGKISCSSAIRNESPNTTTIIRNGSHAKAAATASAVSTTTATTTTTTTKTAAGNT